MRTARQVAATACRASQNPHSEMRNPMPKATRPARRGTVEANFCLDMLVMETGWMTPRELAELISFDGIAGTPNSDTDGPVGLWVVNEMHRYGFGAAERYTWGDGTLRIYAFGAQVLGEVDVPEGHTLHRLDCEVNDLGHPRLLHQGETDPR